MTQALFDEFEAYSENRMVPDQQQAFEERLRQDSVLRSALTDYQQLRHSIEAVKLNRQLDDIHDRLDERGALQHESPVRTVGSPRRLWTRLAIAAVVLLVLGYGIRWSLRPTQAEQTFLAYYQPEPTARGGGSCGPALTTGLNAYRSGNYDQALAALEKLPADEPCVHYYRGLTQLALANAPAAITNLETVFKQTGLPAKTDSLASAAPDLMIRKAEWYLALAYLKADRTADAQQQLRAITRQNEHPFQRVAQKALVDLQHE